METKRKLTRQLQFKDRQRQCKEQFETWEYCEDDYVFAFGEAVIAADERPETHIISISVSNWSCARCVSERHSTAIVFD